MKKLSILGSTGSVGTQTLDVVNKFKDEFKVVGLTANTNINVLKQQIDLFKPEIVAVMDKEAADTLKPKVSIEVLSGIDGVLKVASLESSDCVVNALVGAVGIIPTVEAIKQNKDVALANKETLVSAGNIIMNLVKEKEINLMPIDSEHSAIFQCLNGENRSELNKIILTCSGGPFRNYSIDKLNNVNVAQALDHPTWKMGGKITIDSATLMNKGLEVIEAHYLYDVDPNQIDIVVHPQSIVHSMVEFVDGSIMAQMSSPDMRIPIQYALSYPKRLKNIPVKTDLTQLNDLTFENPDMGRFPCLDYAYNAIKIGGTMPAVMNAANEAAVHFFLNDKIGFMEIPNIIKRVMDSHSVVDSLDIQSVIDADKWARAKVGDIMEWSKEDQTEDKKEEIKEQKEPYVGAD